MGNICMVCAYVPYLADPNMVRFFLCKLRLKVGSSWEEKRKGR